ncbi:WecB/TagA/CpsF family glycosyltransferase [uncultured Albimonas sp.]|uniref:WecB/TagA/CpsF family glycosyltransferase n=1 Tax=uncultured Albimonas sp. TaxID=1331701 RepID=UPI0030EB1860|tara:strand:- start:4757 stop:5530 length:774 start_codon:yes stop_codon:yes gene_type:complete
MRFHLPAGRGPQAVGVTAPTRAGLLAEIEARLRAGAGFSVATINLDHLVKLQVSEPFRRAYAAQDLICADGNPVVWLSWLAARPVELVPGSELVLPLAGMAARLGLPIGLLGADQRTLDAAAARLEAEFPGLRVVARIAPPYGLDPEGPVAAECLRELSASGARLCLLALGAPKQEVLAVRGKQLAPGVGFVSVGAGVEFVAGVQARAPAWVRRLALEWLWRMAREPRRLSRRYLSCFAILPALARDACRLRGEEQA